MKTILYVLLILFSGYVFAQDTEEEESGSAELQYVGAKSCRICHRKEEEGAQFTKWEQSQHSKAYEALKSEAAAKIAKEKGLAKPAYESKECLQCHVTAYDAKPAMLGSKFSIEDGVQCESCHGAGSKYKKKSIMQVRVKAIEMGLADLQVANGSAEKLCKTCHNEKSPTFKGFVFKDMWAKIAHPIPPSE